jgi:hypothetical protein
MTGTPIQKMAPVGRESVDGEARRAERQTQCHRAPLLEPSDQRLDQESLDEDP